MNLNDAEILAINLISKYNVDAIFWIRKKFKEKKTLGESWFKKLNGKIFPMIALRHDLIVLNTQEHVKCCLLHEMAHILTPGDDHHGKEWRRKFKELIKEEGLEISAETTHPEVINGEKLVLNEDRIRATRQIFKHISNKKYKATLYKYYKTLSMPEIKNMVMPLKNDRAYDIEAKKIASNARDYFYVLNDRFYLDFSESYKKRNMSKVYVKEAKNDKPFLEARGRNFSLAIAVALRKIKFIEKLEQIAA